MDSSRSYKVLLEHRDATISSLHLKDLLKDERRSQELSFEHGGIFVDFSRQNATLETVKVRRREPLICCRFEFSHIKMIITAFIGPCT